MLAAVASGCDLEGRAWVDFGDKWVNFHDRVCHDATLVRGTLMNGNKFWAATLVWSGCETLESARLAARRAPAI